MLRWWLLVLVLPIVLLAAVGSSDGQVVTYELACPAGYSPLSQGGKTFDSITKQWRANLCMSDTGDGRMICQMDGCGSGGFPGPVRITAALPIVVTPTPLTAAGVASINTFGGDSGAGGTRGVVPAPGVGDAAALKILGAAGAWVTPAAIGVAAQVQSDWTEANTALPDFIRNKPTIPAAQVQSDWTEANTALPDFILHKPTIPAAQVNSDWSAVSGVAEILNKPTIPPAQIQSDWTEANSALPDYIRNKPSFLHMLSFTIGTPGGADLTAGNDTTDFLSPLPFTCNIIGYSLAAVPSGSVTIKWWRLNLAAPTVSNSINTSGVGISSGTAVSSSTVTDFTSVAMVTGDVLAFNVSAASAVKLVTGSLACSGP